VWTFVFWGIDVGARQNKNHVFLPIWLCPHGSPLLAPGNLQFFLPGGLGTPPLGLNPPFVFIYLDGSRSLTKKDAIIPHLFWGLLFFARFYGGGAGSSSFICNHVGLGSLLSVHFLRLNLLCTKQVSFPPWGPPPTPQVRGPLPHGLVNAFCGNSPPYSIRVFKRGTPLPLLFDPVYLGASEARFSVTQKTHHPLCYGLGPNNNQ